MSCASKIHHKVSLLGEAVNILDLNNTFFGSIECILKEIVFIGYNAFNDFRAEVDALEAKGESRQGAILATVRKFISESSDIMFEGNGYSREWEEESARRGLKAVRNVPEAYKVYIEPQTVEMFNKLGVLSPVESEARYEVLNETYVKKLQIEARIIGDVCLNHVIPAAVSY